MRCETIGASNGLRRGTLGLVSVLAMLAVNANPADARHRGRHGASHGHESHAHEKSYTPPYADFVFDMNSGAVMHATSADSLRHPASLTKMMTLYLLFERLEAGKISLDSPIEISAHAASQAPSKLGLRPGQTIAVEDAIKAVVTKSANDIAVAIGESIGGDEETFAEMMTRKAHALGMSRTEYRNACGLPNDEQVTTARDQATLARALQERFPRYYRYFSTPVFHYRGEAMRNHNHLLGSVEGVDGIKTGYIRASGFNLVTSVRRGNRHIVGVVFGGSSASSRDARMRQLIEQYVVLAAAKKTTSMVAEASDASEARGRVRVADAGASPAEVSQMPRVSPAASPAAAAVPTRAFDPVATAAMSSKRQAAGDPIRPILGTDHRHGGESQAPCGLHHIGAPCPPATAPDGGRQAAAAGRRPRRRDRPARTAAAASRRTPRRAGDAAGSCRHGGRSHRGRDVAARADDGA